MIHQKTKMMEKIGVDRSEELKNNWRGKRFWKLKLEKTEKSKTVEQRKPMNSQVICEISPESVKSVRIYAVWNTA